MSLRESASFTGTGEIVTADGQRFAFTLEVAYQASLDAEVSQSPGQAPARLNAPDVLKLTGTPLPAIEFPGSLNDLFKLLGRELRVPLGGKDGNADQGGNLTMRLLRLVDQAALLAPRPKADEPAPAPLDRSKLLASSYGSAPV